jgi:hypothetical protein
MQRTLFFLVGLVFLSFSWPASAQTRPAPASNTHLGKGVPRPNGAAAPKRTAPSLAVKMDTAAFRRSGRPADGPNRLPFPRVKK